MMNAPLCRNLDEVRCLAQAMDRAQVDSYEMRIPKELRQSCTTVNIAQAVRFGAGRALHAAISADKLGDELLLRVKLTWRPGVRVARAVAEGCTEDLSVDETQLLGTARRILPKDILQRPEIERERWIHDWLCDRVTYRGAADELSDNIYDRNCSAIGAVLDGQANCQGYSDAFYMLGAMAGLTVNIQIGVAGGNHAWNVIRLDGKWYILDVTFDDSAQIPTGEPHYYMFNVGCDLMKGVREWDRRAASAAVAETSDMWFYRQRGWGFRTNDLNSLASYCAMKGLKGEKTVWTVYTGKDVKDAVIQKALVDASAGLPYETLSVNYRRQDGLVYVTVHWNDKEKKTKGGK